jgi:predicted house-cleaning noncanonical NTP pyrophosphatase (MazG superfamily)
VKLVRDGIPEIIEADGSWCLTRSVSSVDEHVELLELKMIEETQEFIENPCYEEAADMLEVIKAFCHLNDLDFEVAINVARNKQETHGGFYDGIILQKVGKE